MATESNAALSKSLQKKRLRDRRAQNAVRERREAHLRALEERMELCAREHGQVQDQQTRDADRLNVLCAALDAIRAENAALRRRQSAVIHLLSGSDPEHDTSTPPPPPPLTQCHTPETDALSTIVADTDTDPHHAANQSPAWTRLPQGTVDDSLSQSLVPWLLFPAVVAPSDDTPAALDILYGSNTNPLSNAIYIGDSCALQGLLGDPERLALGKFLISAHGSESHRMQLNRCSPGYLTYIVAKWRLGPTQERFDRLPQFMRSTDLQTSQPTPP